MADRKDYPDAKLQAMVDAYFAAQRAADHGSRDEYVPVNFMFAAVEAGEAWDAKEHERTRAKEQEIVIALCKLRSHLSAVQINLGIALTNEDYVHVASNAQKAADLTEKIAALEEELKLV